MSELPDRSHLLCRVSKEPDGRKKCRSNKLIIRRMTLVDLVLVPNVMALNTQVKGTWTYQVYITKSVRNSVNQELRRHLDSKPGALFSASTQPFTKYIRYSEHSPPCKGSVLQTFITQVSYSYLWFCTF